MKIDRNEARRIAALAHLELDDAALDRMAVEMTEILGYIDQLREADVTGFEERTSEGVMPMREDVPHEPLGRDEVARNAPEFSDGFFVVPKVIE